MTFAINMNSYQSSNGYLPYTVFTETMCYRAITKMINDEIHERNMLLNLYTENDVRKHLVFDLNEYNGWAIQWIDDVRFCIRVNQEEEMISTTDCDFIVDKMSQCLYNVNAGRQILEKFITNKYKNNKQFVTGYYD